MSKLIESTFFWKNEDTRHMTDHFDLVEAQLQLNHEVAVDD